MEDHDFDTTKEVIETSPTEQRGVGILGQSKSTLKKFLIPLITLVVLAAGGAGYYFYTQYKTAQANPQATAQKEVDALIAQVGKLIILPANETPTIATVSDPEKLKGQAFFVNALQGDKVLIYSTAKKAILYRPSAKKIIEVAPINLGNPAPVPSPTIATPVPRFR